MKNYKVNVLRVVDKVSKNGNNYQAFEIELDNGYTAVIGYANYNVINYLDYLYTRAKMSDPVEVLADDVKF